MWIVWCWKRKHAEVFEMSHRVLLQLTMSDKRLEKITKNCLKGFLTKVNKMEMWRQCQAPLTSSMIKDVQTQLWYIQVILVQLAEKRVTLKDVVAVLPSCTFQILSKRTLVPTMHSCQQNQDVVEVIQTDGYKSK